MGISEMISKSLDYAKEGVWGKWGKWIVLIVISIINGITFGLIPLFTGYIVRVWSGADPAPEVDEWGKLFVDGWKVNIITLVYFIIPFIIFLVLAGFSMIPILIGGAMDPNSMGAGVAATLAGVFASLVIVLIIAFILALFYVIGVIRFAKTGEMGEAFNFKAILSHIGSIGWIQYILSLIVLVIVLFVIGLVLGLIQVIPILGFIIILFVGPVVEIFSAKYVALLYESVPAP
jgi:hypothetical protein